MNEDKLMAAPAPDTISLADAGLRLMADSARPRYIPSEYNAANRLVAIYIDGHYKWPSAQVRRFNKAVPVLVTVTGDLAADVADVESGDMGPAEFADWLRRRREAGHHWHALYSSIDTKPLVDDAVRKAGIEPAVFGWWAANPTGRPHLYPGSIATQFEWDEIYDVSVVTPHWHPQAA